MNKLIIFSLISLWVVLRPAFSSAGDEFFVTLGKIPSKLPTATAQIPLSNGNLKVMGVPYNFELERLSDNLFLLCETSEGVVNVFRNLGDDRIEFFQFKRTLDRDFFRSVARVERGKSFRIQQEDKFIVPKLDSSGVTGGRSIARTGFRQINDKTWIKFKNEAESFELITKGNDGTHYARVFHDETVVGMANETAKGWRISKERALTVAGDSEDARKRFVLSWSETTAIKFAFGVMGVSAPSAMHWFGEETWEVTATSVTSGVDFVNKKEKILAHLKILIEP